MSYTGYVPYERVRRFVRGILYAYDIAFPRRGCAQSAWDHPKPVVRFGVEGLGCGVCGSGFVVCGSGFRVRGLEFGVEGVG
jgi:hypothetical protein